MALSLRIIALFLCLSLAGCGSYASGQTVLMPMIKKWVDRPLEKHEVDITFKDYSLAKIQWICAGIDNFQRAGFLLVTVLAMMPTFKAACAMLDCRTARAFGDPVNGYRLNGKCACTINKTASTSKDVIEHEMKHCFGWSDIVYSGGGGW